MVKGQDSYVDEWMDKIYWIEERQLIEHMITQGKAGVRNGQLCLYI